MAESKATNQFPLVKEMRGFRSGKLVVLEHAPKPTYSKRAHWLCRCDCGKTVIVCGRKLRLGKRPSCGCIGSTGREQHAQNKSPEYKIWGKIVQRCVNPNDKTYSRYGGRGISICEDWRRSFVEFYKYVGPRPSPLHSIDRYPNNNGNYEPGNVRWATDKDQSRNTRRNIVLSFNERTLVLKDWAAFLGVKYSTLYAKYRRGIRPETGLFGAFERVPS